MAVQTLINMTALDGALKERYAGQELVEIGYQAARSPLFALLPKHTDFTGRNYPLPVMSSTSAGISNTFSNAQGNIAAPNISEFLLTTVSKYGLAQLDRKTMLASANDKGAFMAGVEVAVKATTSGITRAIAGDLYRDGTGAIGTISSISTGVITLSNAGDVVNFETNQKLNAVTSGSPRGAAGYVISIDRDAGTVTVATSLGGSAASPSGWTGNDTLCRDGDNATAVSGLLSWLPTSAPSSTAFFGVDRTKDVTRLGGVRYDGSGDSIEEALITGAERLHREGGTPDGAFLSSASFAALAKSLTTRLVLEDVTVGGFGFQAIKLSAPTGTIKVYSDPFCPAKRAFLLTMDSWGLYSTMDAPHIVADMGTGQLLRVYNADAGELRLAAYYQLGCNAPGHNANITLGA